MPTAFVKGLRKVLNNARSVPGELGLRQWAIALVTETWSGDFVSEGTRTTATTALTHANQAAPKVVSNSEKRMMLGVADAGIFEIGPITPVEGVSWANVTQSTLAVNSTAKIRMTHAESGEVKWCVIKNADTDKALGVKLTVAEEAAK
jgi:hypothetical protein